MCDNLLAFLSTECLKDRIVYGLASGLCHSLSTQEDEARRPALSTQSQEEGGTDEASMYF